LCHAIPSKALPKFKIHLFKLLPQCTDIMIDNSRYAEYDWLKTRKNS